MKLMAVGGRRVTREDVTEQVERLVASPILAHSESLCKLLRYLAEHASDHPKTQVKEYQIATEVFGRPADFDPRLDSTVRVQTGRLRSKLAEYYAGPGSQDQWIIEIPKGAYALGFRERISAELPPPAPVPAPPVAAAATPAAAAVPARNLVPVVWALAVALVALSAFVAYLLWREERQAPRPAAAPAAQLPANLTRFWSVFVDSPDRPIVVFSNAEFVGRPETGMRYYEAARDKHAPILDHYTGVGEVTAIHELDLIFSQLGHRLRVKRGRLLSFDDAKQNDLIFVGSPSENLSLRELPNLQEFAFRRIDRPERRGDLGIVNLRPQPGEPERLLASPTTPLTEDYAVVALVPGMGSNRWAMILAGTTTIGTQAAVEFVCRPSQVDELFQRLAPIPAGARPPLFEAVLRVKVSSGVPVSTQLLALHTRKN